MNKTQTVLCLYTWTQHRQSSAYTHEHNTDSPLLIHMNKTQTVLCLYTWTQHRQSSAYTHEHNTWTQHMNTTQTVLCLYTWTQQRQSSAYTHEHNTWTQHRQSSAYTHEHNTDGPLLIHMNTTQTVLWLYTWTQHRQTRTYTAGSHFMQFLFRNFARKRLENFHSSSNSRDNFWFNAILYRWYVIFSV